MVRISTPGGHWNLESCRAIRGVILRTQSNTNLIGFVVLHTRIEPRSAPDLRTIFVEQDRDWKKGNAKECENRTCPRNSEVVVHGWGEKRKSCPGNGSNESVYGDGTVGVEAITVNDVVHALLKSCWPDCDFSEDLLHSKGPGGPPATLA